VETIITKGPAANGNQIENFSIGERIMAILGAEPDGEYTSEDFEREMPGINVPSIRAALARLADEEIITRTRRGYYQAKAQT
jgi:DNA-binding HxlR family transcriptional regulator